ncbi:DNA-binding domain-containing protein [Paraburkholderia sp. J12]|uniref:DNA-binding domain-containing protein n=1 Tax=Paraburkholderia sp. J12 TaxID=2805432 RepID=UPI002ABE33A0|nr:DNA-binding domain-containing protein [Paraburkholderia sp. J12]
MKPTLAAFQNEFVRALHGAVANDSRVAALAAQPGFAVYRNTVFKGCVDALRANFPTVERLVGSDWFRSAARIYAQDEPPEDARLLLYGSGFPVFLAGFEPARELPWLADVARLDRFWTEAHAAADDTVLGAATMAAFSPEDFMRTVLRPHASARWTWFGTHPVYTIWRANREEVALPEDLAWHGEGALLSRAGGSVTWRALGEGGCALLDACAAGRAMEEAMACALEADPDLDLGVLFAGLFADGAFGAAQFPADAADPASPARKQSKTAGA